MCIKVIHEMSVNLSQSTLFFTVMFIVCFDFFKLPCKNLHAHVNLFMRWVIQPHVNLFMRWVIQPHVNLFMRWVIEPHVNLYEVSDTASCEPLWGEWYNLMWTSLWGEWYSLMWTSLWGEWYSLTWTSSCICYMYFFFFFTFSMHNIDFII